MCFADNRLYRLVVRTSRCGRDNPGSTPGVVMCLPGKRLGAAGQGAQGTPWRMVRRKAGTHGAPLSRAGWAVGAWLRNGHAPPAALLPATETAWPQSGVSKVDTKDHIV